MTRIKAPRSFAILVCVFSLSSALLFSRALADAAASAEKGRQLFEKRCTGCHSLDKNKEGPRLRGVYGRKAGSITDFNYSDPLKAATIVWDERLLDKWLTNPDSVVPDNDMAFHVSSAEERTNIIQFLRQSSRK